MLNWMMFTFQNSNSYCSYLMVMLHDFIMMILLIIMVFIMYIMLFFLMNNFLNLNILHNHMLELVWTFIPMYILMFMVIPSLILLYEIEEILGSFLTLSLVGHQWYWSYEYNEFKELEFDSFMLLEDSMNLGYFRLLEVDNYLVVPGGFMVRCLLTSVDVIHSWTIPSLGVKVDAVPGRINQFLMYVSRVGLFYGQCSEICGLNHSFMPIVLESTSLDNFFLWMEEK